MTLHLGGKTADSPVVNKNIIYVKCVNYSLGNIKGKMAICFNPKKRFDIRESRLDEIINARSLLSKNKKIKDGLERYFTPSGRLRKFELDKSEEFDGFSCIFSTKRMSKEDMVSLYFEKDVVEKAFRTLKGITNLRPIRHWLYNRVTAHIFICYLSYLLLSILKMKLQNIGVSPEQALNDLGSMCWVEGLVTQPNPRSHPACAIYALGGRHRYSSRDCHQAALHTAFIQFVS